MLAHLGKSIRLYLVDGTPQGILTAEIMNWTGHVLSGPRTKLPELLKRPEMNRTGIYFLTGPDPDTAGKQIVYIGESDNVGKRLIQHNKDESKDFWEKACIITSKDQNLTKAHARYLESRLIAISQNMARAKVHNNTAPPGDAFLPEADQADMEYFISQIRLILPVLGLEFLREKPRVSHAQESPEQGEQQTCDDTGPVFIARSKKHDITAEAQEIEGDFVVFKGSEAVPEWISPVAHKSYKPLFESLFEEGKLALSDKKTKTVFQEDVSFKSPSAATAVIFGRSSNGRVEWKVKGTNQSYADWQDEKIKSAMSKAA